MSDNVREIAQRLRTMRDIAGFTVEELVKKLSVTVAEYVEMEQGQVDIPVSVLCEAAAAFGISLTELLTGDQAKLHVFSLVRKNRGIGVERAEGYDYTSLAYGFANRKVEPLLVSIPVVPDDRPLHLNSHQGHEFHYLLEGRIELTVANHTLIVQQGDSVYFDSAYPHAMRALDGVPAKILVTVIP